MYMYFTNKEGTKIGVHPNPILKVGQKWENPDGSIITSEEDVMISREGTLLRSECSSQDTREGIYGIWWE